MNALRIDRFTSVGAYLSDENGNEVLMPNKYLTDDLLENDTVNVFVYRDSEDRVVATSEIPYIKLNGFARLYIKEVNFYGAFADWGLEKDLMIPFKEQHIKLQEGSSYFVCLLLDQATDRLYGTTKVSKHLLKCTENIPENTPVDLLIWDKTELGVKAIVNDRYSGMIFQSDLSRNVRPGDLTTGYVANVREDGKIDLRLDPSGYDKIPDSADKLLNILKKRGKLMLSDKSDPETIREAVGMSKKTFKQAVGALYKQRLIELSDTEITLIDK